MITHSVKMSLPLRIVLAMFAFVAGGFASRALVGNCCAAYASGRLAQAADEGRMKEAEYWLASACLGRVRFVVRQKSLKSGSRIQLEL